MENKIVFYLSGKINSDNLSLIQECDEVYIVNSNAKSKYFPNNAKRINVKRNEFDEREIVKLLYDCISDDNTLSNILKCFINDYYSYSIRPAFLIVKEILQIITENSDKKIIFITTKYNSLYIPMYGFKTTESNKGSEYIFYSSLLPQIINNLDQSTQHETIYLKADLLSKKIWRKNALSIINSFSSLYFLLKIVLLAFYKDVSLSATAIVVRNQHQARFAKSLIDEGLDSSVIVLPQLMQGNFSWVFHTRRALALSDAGVSFSITSIFKAYKNTRNEKAAIKRAIHSLCNDHLVSVNDVNIAISIVDMLNEIRILNIFLLYKNFLKEVIVENNISRLLSFELVGRMSGLESYATRETSTNYTTIQTALISSYPLPIFPYADTFITDSYPTVNLISNIGCKSFGSVRYVGPPYIMNDFEKKNQPKKVGFFTQPYELEVSLRILKIVLDWAAENGIVVHIRYHPRDDRSVYQAFLQQYAKFNYIEDEYKDSLSTVFNSIDLTIVRTSSIAKESIAYGIPIIMCLWSEFDRSVKSDYINLEHSRQSYSYDECDLKIKLNGCFDLLRKASLDLKNYIFKSYTIFNLIEELNENV